MTVHMTSASEWLNASVAYYSFADHTLPSSQAEAHSGRGETRLLFASQCWS